MRFRLTLRNTNPFLRNETELIRPAPFYPSGDIVNWLFVSLLQAITLVFSGRFRWPGPCTIRLAPDSCSRRNCVSKNCGSFFGCHSPVRSSGSTLCRGADGAERRDHPPRQKQGAACVSGISKKNADLGDRQDRGYCRDQWLRERGSCGLWTPGSGNSSA